MRDFLIVLVAGLLLTLVSPAEAQVLTFDELVATDNPIRTSLACGETSGFRFHSDHFHVVGTANNVQFSSDGTTHIGYESNRGFPITMTRVGSGTFSLLSLDVAEFWAAPVPERPDAQMLTMTGFRQGGGTVSHTVYWTASTTALAALSTSSTLCFQAPSST